MLVLPYEVAEGIYWVGVYLGKEAMLSLNAFLLKDKETTLIDTGAVPTREALLKNIREVTEPSTLKYVVISHSCVDHVGGLDAILAVAPDVEVVTSEIGARVLALYGLQPKTRIVKDGDTLNLGEKKLRFISAPYLDKMDSMFTYEETNKVLFTADAFSYWVTEWTLFADRDVSKDVKICNDVLHGGSHRLMNALEKIKGMDIKVIAPGHGPMLRSNIPEYVRVLSENIDITPHYHIWNMRATAS